MDRSHFNYLNNAATSYPKPKRVLEAVQRSLQEPPSEPGRSRQNQDPTLPCRERLAKLFHVPAPNQVILTPSATVALNLVIAGCLHEHPKGNCLSTRLEHNSVIRPLEHGRKRFGTQTIYLDPDQDGRIASSSLLRYLDKETRLVVCTQASNVTGCIQPVEEMAEITAEYGVPFLIDASQSAGCVELKYNELPGQVYVAFAGHKGLFGPMGTGGLILPDNSLEPILTGGTGIQSESLLQPASLPIRYEAGTPNLPGIAGLAAGAEFVLERGIESLGMHRDSLVRSLREKLTRNPRIHLSPLADSDGRAGVVSFRAEGWSTEELGFILGESFGIETRHGLHCAPLIHKTIGTEPQGNIRASVSAFNTEDDILKLADALERLVKP